MKFQIVFKKGPESVYTILGTRDVSKSHVTLAELERLPEIEALLERLTGLRVHIQEQC